MPGVGNGDYASVNHFWQNVKSRHGFADNLLKYQSGIIETSYQVTHQYDDITVRDHLLLRSHFDLICIFKLKYKLS